MERELYTSRFSVNFNRLAYLGAWTAEDWWSPMKKKIFFIQATILRVLLLIGITLQIVDLYFVSGNVRKVIFNMSSSLAAMAYPIKVIMLYGKRDRLIELRMNLWKELTALKKKEEIEIQDDVFNQLRSLAICFYIAAAIALPFMLISSYFSYMWGPRELPFALYWPMSDPMDNYNYLPPFIFLSIVSSQVICITMETELSTFSIALQIKAYCKILKMNICKLNDIYGAEDDDPMPKLPSKKEINAFLMKEKAKRLLKDAVIQHLKLFEYSEKFELIFNHTMLFQIITGNILVVLNCVQVTMFTYEMSTKLLFQIAFVTMVLVDFLFICLHTSEITVECVDVSNTIYSTPWYKMDHDIRKRLLILMLRTHKAPTFTAGKLFILDLNTYLHIVRNIYSWLMLMRQLIPK